MDKSPGAHGSRHLGGPGVSRQTSWGARPHSHGAGVEGSCPGRNCELPGIVVQKSRHHRRHSSRPRQVLIRLPSCIIASK